MCNVSAYVCVYAFSLPLSGRHADSLARWVSRFSSADPFKTASSSLPLRGSCCPPRTSESQRYNCAEVCQPWTKTFHDPPVFHLPLGVDLNEVPNPWNTKWNVHARGSVLQLHVIASSSVGSCCFRGGARGWSRLLSTWQRWALPTDFAAL